MVKTLLLVLFLFQAPRVLAIPDDKLPALEGLIHTAELYLDWQYYEEAQKYYLEIMAQDPQRQEIHETMGYINLALQKPAEASAHLKKELQLQPNSIVSKLLLGLAYLQGGDELLAEDLLEEVAIKCTYIMGDPEVAKKYGGNPSFYMKKNPSFNIFMDNNPGLIPFARGILFKRQGRWSKAMGMMKKAVEQNYCLAEVLVQTIDLYLQMLDGLSADNELTRLRREDSQLAEMMDAWVCSRDSHSTMRFAQSRPVIVRYFKKPIDQIVDQLNIMAQESVKRADPKSAFRTWEKALFADGNRFEIRYNLALIYSLYNFQKEALYHCRHAIDLGNPKYQHWALNLAGNIEFEMGNFTHALQYYQQALSLDGKYMKCRNNLGATYLKLGDAEHAEMEWRKVIRHAGRGETEKEVREVDEQEKIKVWVDVKEGDDIIEASRSLATLYILQNRPAEAIPLLDNVLHFIPADAEAHFMLGKVHALLENPVLARRHLLEAIKNGSIRETEARKICSELDKTASSSSPKSRKKK